MSNALSKACTLSFQKVGSSLHRHVAKEHMSAHVFYPGIRLSRACKRCCSSSSSASFFFSLMTAVICRNTYSAVHQETERAYR